MSSLGLRYFTADTNGDLSWQIGFEDPQFMNFLGITIGEKKARAKVLEEARSQYPAPKNCQEANSALVKVRERLAHEQQSTAKKGGPRWVEAMNTILGEHMAYIQQNCLNTPVEGGPVLTDPVGVVTPTTPTTTQPITQQAPAPAVPETGIGAMVKKVPIWGWVAGALILATVTVIAIKK